MISVISYLRIYKGEIIEILFWNIRGSHTSPMTDLATENSPSLMAIPALHGGPSDVNVG